MVRRSDRAGRLLDSAHAVQRVLTGLLVRTPVSEQAHALAQWLASFLVGNSCGIYRCDELEEALLPTDPQRLRALQSRIESRPSVFLHLLSEPYQHGGHTRVARHLMAHAHGMHEVLLTRRSQSPDAHLWLGVDASRVRWLPNPTECSARVEALAVEIAAHAQVVLYLHPDDVVGGAAVRLARKLNPHMRVGFFNHADHAFSVGIGSADCVFEISTYGWQLRQIRGIEGLSSFVGIPIEVPRAEVKGKGSHASPPKVLLAGTAYKFKPVGDQALLESLALLLSSTPGLTIDLVGPDGSEPWWNALHVRFRDRMRFHGLLAHDAYKALLDSATLYVDSYPKTGGTAFPEALLSGAKVVGLFGGTWGFSVADVLRAHGSQAFVARCEAIFREDSSVLQEMEWVRRDCASFHAPYAVWQRVCEGLCEGATHPPPEALASMPKPPILAEDEWLAHGRLSMRLPDRDSPHAKWVHGVLWKAHSEIFGPLHPGSLRWAATWVARYALRSA